MMFDRNSSERGSTTLMTLVDALTLLLAFSRLAFDIYKYVDSKKRE